MDGIPQYWDYVFILFVRSVLTDYYRFMFYDHFKCRRLVESIRVADNVSMASLTTYSIKY